MNKRKLPWDKLSLMKIISLGSVVLGVGFIFWGGFSVWGHQDYQITNAAEVDSTKAVKGNVAELIYEEVPTVDEVLYPEYPVQGDNIGRLMIPVLDLELPVFQGTGSNELKKGVGHFIQSVLPGEMDNTVLSGHRDTVFRKIGDLTIGDLLIVETSAGVFTYEVSGTRIVDKDDRTVIVPTEHAVLTMTTCYPFTYVGPAPERYIVSADLLVNE